MLSIVGESRRMFEANILGAMVGCGYLLLFK